MLLQQHINILSVFLSWTYISKQERRRSKRKIYVHRFEHRLYIKNPTFSRDPEASILQPTASMPQKRRLNSFIMLTPCRVNGLSPLSFVASGL